ncbi:WD repeat-containing protein 27 isoform X4 [Siphateles boraxobius]|uniref:WD repeat-containing protein 27 isoform X4 n=1 Tax=Siphateles boraxobius TaxID=180520 RepID=UPI00406372C2
MAAVTSEQYFVERFAVTCNNPVSHLQLTCCPTHCAVPWQGKNIKIYENNNLESPLELTGHHSEVSAMVFGTVSDRLILCSASEDYVIVWDIYRCYRQIKEGVIASGRVVGTLLGRVVHLSLCPLSWKVAACSGSRVVLLNAEKEEVLGVLKAHLGPVTASEFCPWDANLLISISEDRTFKMWDVKKGDILFESAVLSAYPLLSLFFLEQNSQFITGSGDGQLWCYTLPVDHKCRLVTKLDLSKLEQKHERNLRKINPPQNGTHGDLSISIAESWAITHGHGGNMCCLVSSLFGNSVVLFEVNSAWLDKLCFRMAKSFSVEEHLSVVPSSPLMTMSPLNAELAKQDPKPQRKIGVSCQKTVKDQALVFHTQVKSSGYNAAPHRTMFRPKTNVKKKTHSASTTTTNTKGLLNEYPSHFEAPSVPYNRLMVSTTPTTVNSLQYSGDGKQLVCGLGDSSVLLYNSPLTGNPAVYTGHSKAVNTVCWSHSRRWFMSTCEDPTLCIWTASASEPVLTMFTKPIRTAQFYYLDKFLLLASGSNLMLYLYHLDTTRDDIKRYTQRSKSKLASKLSMKSGTDITSMSAINDFYSYIILAAGADRTIQVFDMNQGCIATQIPDAHSRAVHHLTQNKGSSFCSQALESYNLFLSSAITDGLKLWDLRTARCVRRYESHVNRCHNCTAAFSPCGRFIATGSEDHCAYIYDTRSSNFLHKLQRHSETVLNVAFNPANPELLTGTLDGKLALFHPAESLLP